MDENTIGFKPKQVIERTTFVKCPDLEFKYDKMCWFEKMFASFGDQTLCIHIDECNNYEGVNNSLGECTAGYWKTIKVNE
ncbi:MAG: hypothetical protein KAJ40_02750 [Alphaproteobacteria bacterium]|nr:hypothetical protein [Alphaproteobacteria bacterium]